MKLARSLLRTLARFLGFVALVLIGNVAMLLLFVFVVAFGAVSFAVAWMRGGEVRRA